VPIFFILLFKSGRSCCERAEVNFQNVFAWLLMVAGLFKRSHLISVALKNLRDSANAFGATFSEKKSHAFSNVFWMSDKSEQDGSSFISVQAVRRHDPLNHRRLSDTADVNGGLKPSVDSS